MLFIDKNDVYVWGYGILGFGPNVAYTKSPRLLPPTLFGRNEFNSESKVVSISAGLCHFAAITSNLD